jgi:glycerol-3-phosphate acyltransferase PlsX
MGGVRDFKKKMDYREYGGAPLLGVKAPVIKGHGSSDVKAVLSAINQARRFVETGFVKTLEQDIEKSGK